jgi:hypothetical protein
MFYKKETISDLLRIIANEYGYHHRNKFYIDKVEELKGVRPKRQHVNSVIGPTSKRKMINDENLTVYGKTFLRKCDNDLAFAKRVLENCYV